MQAKTDNNPFHLELDEADSEATTKKVKIPYPAQSKNDFSLLHYTGWSRIIGTEKRGCFEVKE